jgi:hypothetical protein
MALENASINDPSYSQTMGVPADQAFAPQEAAASKLKGLDIPPGWRNPTIKQLNAEHPSYTDVKDDWIKMSMLYEGGHVMRKNSTQFLIRRPRELQEVYQARVDRFTYHNILGTCFGWYRAAMFKNPPTVDMKTVGKDGQPDGKDFAKDLDAFYIEFRKNCDRKKTSLVDLMREVFTSLALYRTAYVLLDIPRDDSEARSLRDQKQSGVLDQFGRPSPYLVIYSPVSVINWDTDPYGNLTWCVLAYQDSTRGFVQTQKIVDTWYYFDRQQFLKYQRVRKPGETEITKVNEADHVVLVDGGKHALAKANQVPLLRFEVPDGLWLSNRAYLPVLDHLNQDNAYGWALYMANLAMPVVTSDQDIKPQLSEAGFIQLPLGSTYAWSEPEGKSFARSAERVKELREEIFRAMYLTYQGRASTATADGASGSSKEMDMMPAQDIMNEYGDVVIAAMQQILDAVAQSRQDVTVRSDVRGLKFGKSATLDQIQRAEAALSLGIPSKTFEKEVYCQAAQEFLPDMNPETAELIRDEILKAPSNEEKEAQEADQRRQMYSQTLDKAVQNVVTPPVPPKKKAAVGVAALTDGK